MPLGKPVAPKPTQCNRYCTWSEWSSEGAEAALGGQAPKPSVPDTCGQRHAQLGAGVTPAKARVHKKASARVASVRLDGFRGVPGALEVHFGAVGSAPTSAIVFGENGSGKSSIVDAVEWACQGTVGRGFTRGMGRPQLVNAIRTDAKCSCYVSLSTGECISRVLSIDGEGLWHVRGDAPLAELCRVPMALKRADVLRFLDTPPEKRASLFVDHALADEGDGEQSRRPTDEQRAAREDLLAAKVLRRQAAASLARLLGVDPAPTESGDIDRMLLDRVYGGIPRQNWHRVTVPSKLEAALAEIEDLRLAVRQANRRCRALAGAEGSHPRRVRELSKILGDVSEWMTIAFATVTGAAHVRHIHVLFGRLSPSAIEVEIELAAGARYTPQQIFSEGYQDLVSLLFFLAIARAAAKRGQARILILDDVLQSVDAAIRVSIMNLIVRDFRDWQLLVTVHDRLWRTQLRDIFQRAGQPVAEIEIQRWEFDYGPRIAATTPGDLDSALWTALSDGDPATVCGVAGRLLEQICDRMSWTIPISVKRKRGDAYTLADLWPGTMKELKRTTAAPALAAIDTWLHLRNAAGAHYNEWAESLTSSEAEAFGFATLDLLAAVRCVDCKDWIERIGPKTYGCRCGKVSIRPTS